VSIGTRALDVVPAALVAYAVIALARGRWLSGLAAPVVAWLLVRRHRRARFATYVFATVVLVRAAVTRDWWIGAGTLVVIALLQLPSAVREWPRIRPGFPRPHASESDASDRMARP